MIVGAMASGVSSEEIRQTGVGQEIINKAEKFMSSENLSNMVNFNDPKTNVKQDNEIQN